MKLHKAGRLFEEKTWLRGAIHNTTLFGSDVGFDVEEYIERTLHDICFYPFENLSMEAKPTWHNHFLELGNGDSAKEVRFRVTYTVVCNIEGYNAIYWSVDRPSNMRADTIKETIADIEKYREEDNPNKKIRYIAIVRKKIIDSCLGELSGYDIFEFPEGWQPQVS